MANAFLSIDKTPGRFSCCMNIIYHYIRSRSDKHHESEVGIQKGEPLDNKGHVLMLCCILTRV